MEPDHQFKYTESLESHRDLIQMLYNYGRRKLRKVELFHCLKSVENQGEYLVLTSGAYVPPLDCLQTLIIQERTTTLDNTLIEGIFQYVSRCKNMEFLRFGYCLVPRMLYSSTACALLNRGLIVSWYPENCILQYNEEENVMYWDHNQRKEPMTTKEYEDSKVKYYQPYHLERKN